MDMCTVMAGITTEAASFQSRALASAAEIYTTQRIRGSSSLGKSKSPRALWSL